MNNDLKQKILSRNYTEEDLLIFADSINNKCTETILLLNNLLKIKKRLEEIGNNKLNKKIIKDCIENNLLYDSSLHISKFSEFENFYNERNDFFYLLNDVIFFCLSERKVNNIINFLKSNNEIIEINNLHYVNCFDDPNYLLNNDFLKSFKIKNFYFQGAESALFKRPNETDSTNCYNLDNKFGILNFNNHNIENLYYTYTMRSYDKEQIDFIIDKFLDTNIYKLSFSMVEKPSIQAKYIIRKIIDNENKNKNLKELSFECNEFLLQSIKGIINSFLSQDKLDRVDIKIRLPKANKHKLEDIFNDVNIKFQQNKKTINLKYIDIKNSDIKDSLENNNIILVSEI